MGKYDILKIKVKIIDEIKSSDKKTEIASISDLAKMCLIKQLCESRDNFTEYIDRKINEVSYTLEHDYTENLERVKGTKDILRECDCKKEISIIKDEEKLSLLKRSLEKSITKITFSDGEFDYNYLDVYLDGIDEDGNDNDDENDSPLFYLIPNFVLNDGGGIESYENYPLEVYLDEIKEVIIDGIKYKFICN